MISSAAAREEMFDSATGIRILVRSWVPESTPRAVIVLCHGVNAHGGFHATQRLWKPSTATR